MSAPLQQKNKPKIRNNSSQKNFVDYFGKPITEYKTFQRAIEGKAKATQINYKTKLPNFFVFLKQDPDTVIANRQKDLMDMDITENERYEREVKSYIRTIRDGCNKAIYINVIQGFFTGNSKRLSLGLGKLKIPLESKKRKYSPNNEDVKKLLSYADCARDKLIVSIAFQNGSTPVDIANLRIGDYPNNPWVYYTMSRVKTGVKYHSCSTPDVCRFLKEYLVIRGGKVGESLFMGREGVLDSSGISAIVKGLIDRAGFKDVPGFVPKCLRDGFADALIDADVYLQIKEAMMGHGSNIYHQYGSQKKVEERVIEAMKKVYPLICLSTEDPSVTGSGTFTNQDLEDLRLLKQDVALIKDKIMHGELVDIHDPQLKEKLRAKGVLL